MPSVNTRTLTLSSNYLVKFYHSVPPHQLTVTKCRDEDCDDFLPWLEKKAGAKVSSSLYIGKSHHGRSLFAAKNIRSGDCLLKVPYKVKISADNMHPQIIPFVDDKVSNDAKIATVILMEQKKGQDSEWAPYISRLPQLGEMHSAIFWSQQELEMIQQSSVYQKTVDEQAQVKNDYLTLQPVFDRFPELFEDVTFENFKHAYGLVASRAWGCTKGLSLIPFADFLNHDGISMSVLSSCEDNQVSEIIADRDYVIDDEVMIRYGKFPNSELLLDYGFTVSCNIHDQVDIPSDDCLRAMKLDLLQKHCIRKSKDASYTLSGGSFVIKEVRSSGGKGIPQSLRAFARVLCCASSKELNDLALEATQHDGRLARRPLMNRSLEMHSHGILLSLINQLIDKCIVSIQSVDALKSTTCRNLARRQIMAKDLLTGEVRVLRSASAWLEKYCRFNIGQRTSVNLADSWIRSLQST